ncbi:hypothetical protein MGN01_46000 [Methylobacterium gnaphalii]|uniref:Uncharacterized protein n=1 Tax=Methylobacterium gnaphalii TaxID=1010610 RepID=A0A512JS31_9HYPH|nr:hypothetical protein MGN01_46000 [Methylobacterium gnaphalii]
MTYVLHQLAAGNYDLLLDSMVIGSVVRGDLPNGHVARWRAELLDDGPAALRPHPFIESEHQFESLSAVKQWLANAVTVKRQVRRPR